MKLNNTIIFLMAFFLLLISGCSKDSNPPKTVAPPEGMEESFLESRKVIDDSTNSMAETIIPAADGGYFIYVNIYADISSSIIIKTDPDLNEIWRTEVSNESGSLSYDTIVATKDGGCMHARMQDKPGYGFYLLKLDSSGKLSWKKDIAGRGGLVILKASADGGYILSTTDWSDYAMKTWTVLIGTDSNGNETWRKEYKEDDQSELNKIVVDSDGNIIAAGYSFDGCSGPYSMFMVKTDKSGKELWRKRFSTYYHATPSGIVQTSDGNFFLGFNAKSSMHDDSANANFIKISPNGYIIREMELLGESVSSLCSAPSDGLIFINEHTVVRVDSSGCILWRKDYGNSAKEEYQSLIDVIKGSDNRYIIVGRRSYDAFAIVTVPDEEIMIVGPTL